MTETLHLKIGGMHCSACVRSIEVGLDALPGISSAQVSLVLGAAMVEFDPTVIDEPAIIARVRETGYTAVRGESDFFAQQDDDMQHAKQRATQAGALAIPLMLLAMGPMLATGLQEILHQSAAGFIGWGMMQALISAVIMAGPGRGIYQDAFVRARNRESNMNTLIAVGTIAAFGWSLWLLVRGNTSSHDAFYFESAGVIIAIVLTGQLLEARARHASGSAIRSLLVLRPRTATVIINGVTTAVDADELLPGMTVLVRPGERLPADGAIIDGEPEIDEALVTGESLPVRKNIGDEVIGGSMNGSAQFAYRVTRHATESFLADIVRLVSHAQLEKAPIQREADRIAGIFVPVVLCVSILTAVMWLLLAPGNPLWIQATIAVLIVACPCALGLATPTAILVASSVAARQGMLFRSGEILERIARIKGILFDKTGTLSTGQFSVDAIEPTPHASAEELLGVAASLAATSTHPLSRALQREAEARGISYSPSQLVRQYAGRGTTGSVQGIKCVIGSPEFVSSVLPLPVPEYDNTGESSKAVVWVARGEQLLGRILLHDTIRDDAASVIADLKSSYKVALLSGDTQERVTAFAREVGISMSFAATTPAGKLAKIDEWKAQYGVVAMVGDGINDAPALARADVGLAIGSGADVALASAGVVLLRPDLELIPKAFELGKKTVRIIRQNLFWAFLYNLICIPLAAGALYPTTGLMFSPMLAALLMALSSLFVVTNALRLAR